MALWRLFQTLVSLAIVNIAYAPWPYPRIHPEIGSFNEKDYYGNRAQGIATIRYTRRLIKWKKQPHICHGVFVDPLKVVLPCSCLAYPGAGDVVVSNPWFHQTNDDYTMLKVDPGLFSVGVLTDEFLAFSGGQPVNRVGVTKVQIANRCTPNYRRNLGMITLTATPKGAKLAWLYSADWLVMKWATEKAIMGAAGGAGRCEVLRWSDHGKPFQHNSRVEKGRARYHDKPIRYDKDGHQRVLQAHAVQIMPWAECLEQVCPQYAAPPYDKVAPRWDILECYNTYNVTRYCVGWMQMDSLCLLPEGTPVFCDVGELHGVFGLLVNHTIWCEQTFNFRNVMVGMDTITNALYTIARIRNGPGYDNFGWPEYMDDQRTPDDYTLL